jgi:hypothetical protein
VDERQRHANKLVRACDIAEIVGDMSSEELDEKYSTLEALNADIADFSFTQDAEFTEA